jgi:hypothetical protein
LRVEWTRRGFLKAASAGAAWIALYGALGCEQSKRKEANASPEWSHPRTFRSRPDLSPPSVRVNTSSPETAQGYVFAAPKTGPSYQGAVQNGPMILDNDGQPVWFRPTRSREVRAMDFKVQQYRGEPVLTYYEGVGLLYGQGEYVILDSSYRELTRVRAGNGYRGDHHEFFITPQDTALFTVYSPVRWDLTSVGGPQDGFALDGIAQEVDIQTGEVLFEWHSLDHVGIEETYRSLPENPDMPFDYFHINSIDVDSDDNLLVSSRTTFAVYKIDRKSGEVIWQLGGKKSDFEMGEGTWMRYQHDARRQTDGTITVFDNGGVHKDEQSSGIVLELDEGAMTAKLVREYTHPDEILAAVMANVQLLPNGNAFIGWGSQPLFSEFSKDGELILDALFPPKVNSYRAFRFPWKGQPTDAPAVAVEAGSGEEVTVFASWNGTTEVASWQLLAGPVPDDLKPVASAPRDGFETTIKANTTEPYVGVRAKDRSGRVLGTSEAIRLRR